MATVLELVNGALDHLGATPITQQQYDAGNTGSARTAKSNYEDTVVSLLAAYPFTWSIKKVQLVKSGVGPLNEYAFKYDYPEDMIEYSIVATYLSRGANSQPVPGIHEPYEDGIYSDFDPLVIDYQFRVPEASFPKTFEALVKAALAAAMAEPITDQRSKADHWLEVAYGSSKDIEARGGLLRRCINVDARSRPPRRIRGRALIDARR